MRTADRIVAVVRAFANEQRGDIKKLKGSDLWRLRVGDWRVFLKVGPTEIEVVEVTDRQDAYVTGVVEALKNQGFRATSDLRNEKVGFKIRDHTLQRVPYLLVAGDKEVAAHLVSVRTRSGKDLGTMPLAAFVERRGAEVARRGRNLLEE